MQLVSCWFLFIMFSIPASSQSRLVTFVPFLPRIFSKQGRFRFCRLVCISSPVSAPLPLLYLQTCLLFLWTWLFLPRNYVPAFQRMDCSEGAFLSLTAVHIHPNVSVLIRQEPTKPFCMSHLTLWIIWGLSGSKSLFQLHSLMFLLTHEYNPAQNTAKLPRCVIYYKNLHCKQVEILCWDKKKTKDLFNTGQNANISANSS